MRPNASYDESRKVNEKRIQDNLYITKGQIFAEFVLEALKMPRWMHTEMQRVAFDLSYKPEHALARRGIYYICKESSTLW